MDVIELVVILVECIVIGAGMAIGDWVVKIIAVRLINDAQQASLHDVEDEEEEETKVKRRRRAAPKPDAVGPGSGSPFGVVP